MGTSTLKAPLLQLRIPKVVLDFVLDNSPNLGYTLASDLLLTRGALARRRSVGAGTVP